jgi:hypothetical protein
MKVFLYGALFILTFNLSLSFSQPVPQKLHYEHGSIKDLKGVSKIYVSAGSALQERNNIVSTIQKKLNNIKVTKSAKEAEVVLFYFAFVSCADTNLSTKNNQGISGTNVKALGDSSGSYGYYAGMSPLETSTSAYNTKVINSNGEVLKSVGENKFRLIMKFKDKTTAGIGRDPSTNFAKAFIKAYESANK